MMRAAFRTILEAAGHEVVGEAGDGDEALDVTERHAPDVVGLADDLVAGRLEDRPERRAHHRLVVDDHAPGH
ncbi:MAG: DNA-binding response regulator, partial [Actinomycetota bacterium]